MGEIKKILVANRGEIAVRIIRAIKELGLTSVAVYSEADTGSLHVLEADESCLIGPPPPLQSYLDMDRIIEAARSCGADAIHPGYGFLAENPAFSGKVRDAGLVFIGPPAEAIRLMGDKLEARALAKRAGVPITPGSDGPVDLEHARRIAGDIGFPVLIKAAHGGGGKGMHIVRKPDDLQEALETSIRESSSAFGSSTVYLEKYLEEPRHIEVQVLADSHGTVLHLFERECSVQRRHQKIIEETPSMALTPELRTRMTEAAVALAREAGYVNAGTVEFLFSKGEFYFLEMNTRIQVEHPVTEMVTGVDLVKWQIRIARGEKLTLKQEDLRQQGHSIECRVYAENPEANFLPAPGTLHLVREPSGPGIRVDSGIRSGFTVPAVYDPILSKVVTWAETRDDAIDRMDLALKEYVVLGTPTIIPYLRDVLAHEVFRSGHYDTHFVGDHMNGWKNEIPEELLLLACGLAVEGQGAPANGSGTSSRASGPPPTPWQTLGRFRLGERS
ncbi:MAG TPA: acetyl-CoA carboxylase biotin carboxylase subunit [Thermoanaerobaculia bacterium]|nr:acetyl-CoA carboxylase biotin carboxylase subunit [Thermoanaerobaculia bacterium]HUM30017.1 acetyl-CoA carboxylase biotin carboxylase subunit [Thermoanaerobaculia bacterium]HXK68294.1 acetyl-CoA carboxylase biotin carboxylase subunit [Thermoanaerobaculia bacterium]